MSEFATTNLGLASALYAAQLMNFIECRRVSNHVAEFVFDNPGQDPDLVVQQFQTGTLLTPAIGILTAQRVLRRKTDALFGRNKTHSKEVMK